MNLDQDLRGSRPEVLVTWPDYSLEEADLGAALVGAGADVRVEPKLGARTAADTLRIVGPRTVGAIVSTDPFRADLFAERPALRVIARVGVGTDSIDLEAATAAGVAVAITPGANEATVADHTVALMLAVQRRICEHDAGVRAGRWERVGDFTPWTLSGSTVGLIGYGRIGRLVARRLSGFDIDLLTHDPVQRDEGSRHCGLDELLESADVVSLHVPLTAATTGLIGTRELSLMRPDSILINTARGGVVDEAALIAALDSGAIRAAGVDVFEEEPPQAGLAIRSDVVLSPHNAGISVSSVREMTLRATKSVLKVLAGRAPEDLANPGVLDTFRAPAGLAGGPDA
jgi:phosphoglycerate dehydrogenase-like enzyme